VEAVIDRPLWIGRSCLSYLERRGQGEAAALPRRGRRRRRPRPVGGAERAAAHARPGVQPNGQRRLAELHQGLLLR